MSLLIKGVQVVDGTGKEPFKADVLVQGGFISSVGEIRGRKADQIIEGLGHFLTPGFIDVHNRSDHSLSIFADPEQDIFVRQGVTTIIGGQQGFSLAPVVYGTIESVHRFADHTGVNTNWNTVREFLDELERFRLGINFGTLAGYANVRGDITSGRKLIDKKELQVIHKVLRDAIVQGALGISLQMDQVNTRGELSETLRLADSLGVVCTVGIAGSKEGYAKAAKEIIDMAKGSKVKVIIDGVTPARGSSKDFKEAVAIIKGANKKDDKYRFLVQPHGANEIHIRNFLPKVLEHASPREAVEKMRQVKYINAAKKEWQGIDFRSIRVASAPTRHFLAGKSIVEIANNWGSSYIDAMLRLMELSGLKATLIHEDVNASLLRSALSEEAALITANSDGSRSGGGVRANEEAASAFPQYFRTVMSEGLVSIEEAVFKISGAPAKFFGIPYRGIIEEGRPADLVILGKDDYGIRETVVNGEVYGQQRLEGKVVKRTRH
ncbi:MAG: amidohydrolase family protein [bacterium]|nr:amidohydrolase family protein [bacterium]MDZ4231543.1 amidohydrolase family protein [Patescibacteria group bacterium]